jgi:AraC-like DNA-binding protein
MLPPRPFKERAISRAQLAALADGAGSNFRILAPEELPPEDVAVRGDFRIVRFRSGLVMHCSDTREVFDLTTQVVQEPGLSCFLFLTGTVDMRLGDRTFALGRDAGLLAGPLHGKLINCAEPDLLTRISKKSRHIRKVVVTLPPDWMEEEEPGSGLDRAALRAFGRTHLASADWQPSPRIVSLAEQILHPPAYGGVLHNLYVESRSIEIVAEALRSFSADNRQSVETIRTRDHERIRAIAALLGTKGYVPSSLEDLARDAGMSVSSLQRHFRLAYGMTVFEFVRNARLDEARRSLEHEGLSIAEAAYRAGYSNPANFATAFKRRFGVSPKNMRS